MVLQLDPCAGADTGELETFLLLRERVVDGQKSGVTENIEAPIIDRFAEEVA